MYVCTVPTHAATYLDAVAWTRETLCGAGHAGSGALSRLKMDGWALLSLGAECEMCWLRLSPRFETQRLLYFTRGEHHSSKCSVVWTSGE
jgi:hypothetical protein